MAQTRRVPVFGTKSPCAYQSRLDEHNMQLQMDRMEPSRRSAKPEYFVCYKDIEEEEKSTILHTRLNYSFNFVDYMRNREYGMREYRSVNKNHGTRHFLTHDLFKEYPIPLKTVNKVFCSQWLSSKEIVFGTKCNKLLVYNVNSQKLNQIPLITRHVDETVNQQGDGIYSLKINSSRSLLATSAHHSNNIAIYRLPTLNPIVLAEGAHEDLIFDIEWLDDEFFVSGSRDAKIALWQVQDQYEDQYDTDGNLIQPGIQHIKPTVTKTCKTALNVRAIIFNKHLKEMVTTSLNGYFHIWDVQRFKQRCSRRLPLCQENVCLTMKADSSLYASGCLSYTLLLDSRTLQTIKKIPNKYSGYGIRSLSFQDNIITIGTGFGAIMCYDIRATKYLHSSINPRKAVILRTSKGYVHPDEDYLMDQEFQQVKYNPAIYTHCYDYSGTRLFSAGGPLLENLYGNYVGLWQ